MAGRWASQPRHRGSLLPDRARYVSNLRLFHWQLVISVLERLLVEAIDAFFNFLHPLNFVLARHRPRSFAAVRTADPFLLLDCVLLTEETFLRAKVHHCVVEHLELAFDNLMALTQLLSASKLAWLMHLDLRTRLLYLHDLGPDCAIALVGDEMQRILQFGSHSGLVSLDLLATRLGQDIAEYNGLDLLQNLI